MIWLNLLHYIKDYLFQKDLRTSLAKNDRVKNIKTPSQKPRKLRTNIWFKYFLEHGLFIRTVLVAKTDPV